MPDCPDAARARRFPDSQPGNRDRNRASLGHSDADARYQFIARHQLQRGACRRTFYRDDF